MKPGYHLSDFYYFMILLDGIIQGRKIFANTIMYVFMAASGNFGNMFSAALIVLSIRSRLPLTQMFRKGTFRNEALD